MAASNGMDAVGDIKQRLLIEDVVADYMELKRAGRNFKALSPFTNEKTPSFIVSPDKQIWHDFSSNKGGDMFTFIEEVEGVDFKEALELLARKAGVDLSRYQKSGGMGAKKKQQLEVALTHAARYYQKQLLGNKEALAYVTQKRQFRRKAIEDFLIGYAPQSSDALTRFLKDKGVTDSTLTTTGLAVKRSNRLVDMFRGRVLVALADRQGRVVGFTGRKLRDEQNGPKYINTPQTPLYDKSNHVFGLHLAKQAIREEDLAIVVEGNLDVVSAHQFGSKNVVATAGTALTALQLRQLKHLSSNVAFAFDSDRAGLQATLRAIPIAQKEDMRLSIMALPEGSDPDDLIKDDPKRWQQVIEDRMYAIDWVIEYYAKQFDLNSAEGKSRFSKAILDVLKTVTDPVEQDHYLQVIAERTHVEAEAVRRLFTRIRGKEKPRAKRAIKASVVEQLPHMEIVEDTLLALCLKFPQSRYALEQIDPDDFDGDQRTRIAHILCSTRQSADDLMESELKKEENFVKILQLKAEEQFGAWTESDVNVEADRLALRLMKLKTEQNQQQLSRAIREAEARGDHETAKQLLEQWQELQSTEE